LEIEVCADGETPDIILKEGGRYRRGQFAIPMSFFRGKVYLHIQGDTKSRCPFILKMNIF
jgi:hypothetical protein